MSRVDFYLCRDGDSHRAMEFACRLCAKAFRSGLGIRLNCASAQQARLMDEMLWTYSPSSFLPHTHVSNGETIEINGRPARNCTMLVNLDDTLPHDCKQYERIAEVVSAETSAVDQARMRYKQYRSMGCQLNNHQV